MTSQPSGRAARRILLVEDDAGVRRVIAAHLHKGGHTVVEAERGEDASALAAFAQPGFDLVLTDVHLPGVSGVELVAEMVARDPLRPVVVITGDPDARIAEQAMRQGAAGYLLKPFVLFELDAVVAQALSRLEMIELTLQMTREHTAAGAPDADSFPASWVRMAEERSDALQGHGDRVALVAAALARQLGDALTAPDRKRLETAARLHELGRLFGGSGPVPLAVQAGKLLEKAGFEPEVCDAVRHSREQWAGGGGPDELAGDAIPRLAALLSVADAIDHLACHRISAGDAPEAAIAAASQFIEGRAGSMYAPYAIEALRGARSEIAAGWTEDLKRRDGEAAR